MNVRILLWSLAIKWNSKWRISESDIFSDSKAVKKFSPLIEPHILQRATFLKQVINCCIINIFMIL